MPKTPFSSAALPHRFQDARTGHTGVAGNKRQIQGSRSSDDQAIKGIALEGTLIGEKDLGGGQIQRLIRRVTEQIIKERTDTTAQIDLADSHEQAAFPNDRDRDVQNGFARSQRLKNAAARRPRDAPPAAWKRGGAYR